MSPVVSRGLAQISLEDPEQMRTLAEQAADPSVVVDFDRLSPVDHIRHREHPGPGLIRAAIVRKGCDSDSDAGLPQRQLLGVH